MAADPSTAAAKNTRGRWASFTLWLSLGCLMIIILYVILVYTHDQRARDTRNTKHNLRNYVDYALSAARLPRGHIESPEELTEDASDMHSVFRAKPASKRLSA